MAPHSPVIVTSDPHLLAQWRYDERRRWPDPHEPAAQAAAMVLGRHTDRVEIRSAAEVSAVTESARTIAETAPPVLKAGLLDLASRITVAAAPLTGEGNGDGGGEARADGDDWLSQLDARIAAPAHEPPAHEAAAAYEAPAFEAPAYDAHGHAAGYEPTAYTEPAADAPAGDEAAPLDWADALTSGAPPAPDDAFYVPPAAEAEPAPPAPWEMAEAEEAAAGDEAPADDAFYIPPHAEEPAAEPAPWEAAAEPEPAAEAQPEPWALPSDAYAPPADAPGDDEPTADRVPAMHIAQPQEADEAPPPLPEIALFAPAVAPHAAPEPEPAAHAEPEPAAAPEPPAAAPALAPPPPPISTAPAPAQAPSHGGAAEALASLGAGMGMTVTGRGREGTDAELAEMDVVWMQGGKVVAVFVVDPAPVLDGVLRVSDMLASRPGIHLPFYVVAPQAARAELRAHAHRPTFARLNPPLADAVRFLGAEALEGALGQVTGFLRYLRPEFIESLAEPLG